MSKNRPGKRERAADPLKVYAAYRKEVVARNLKARKPTGYVSIPSSLHASDLAGKATCFRDPLHEGTKGRVIERRGRIERY